MKRVFLCHSTQNADVARDLCARLESAGVKCWIAPRDIRAGDDWSAAIPPAIDACAAIVVILSSGANASRQITHELHLAHGSGKPIVPFRIEPIRPEGALRYLLSGIHYIDSLEEPRNAAFDELVEALTGFGDTDGGSPDHLQRSVGPDTGGVHRPRTNLPLPTAGFLARDADLEQLRSTAARTKLLTLFGTGGVGKTRLALELARELLPSYEDGAWFVDLSLAADGDAVAAATAASLSIRTAPGQTATDAITAGIRDKHMLVVFDGCDRVREAAADVAQAILACCPRASMLVTSRQALQVSGEVVATVGPLDPRGAIELFVERARAVSSAFAATTENADTLERVCARLDGIPLAIELAAAKMRVIGLNQLDDLLGERFRILSGSTRGRLPHQQTLRATIDWSYDLLDERERALFRRLAIFSGGWTLQAATRVCGADEFDDEWAVLDVLASLVDKSLVVAETLGERERYRMLNSIREYGLERLAQAGESSSIAVTCAEFFAALVHDLTPLALALEDAEWRRRFAVELDNVRTALETTIFQGNHAETGLALLSDVEWPELVTTPQEALRWFETAATLTDAMPSALVHARILRHCAVLEWLVGRPLAKRERTTVQALELARSTGDANETARAYGNLGATYRSDGRFEEADAAFGEAYRTPELLSTINKNAVLRQWAVSDLQRGATDLARMRFAEVANSERPGSEAHASALLNLGELEFASGNVERARDAARKAKDTYARLGSVYLVLLLSNLGAYAMAAGDLDDARQHLREALRLQRRAGPAWLGTVLEHHALLAGLIGEHERAALLAGFTEAHYASCGEVRQQTEQRGYERLMQLLGELFAAEELARRLEDGARLTREEAVTEAAAIHQATTDLAAAPPR